MSSTDIDDLLGGTNDPMFDQRESRVEGPEMAPKKPKAKTPPPEPIKATREQIFAALAYQICLAMGTMDRLTFAAHRERLEAALEPCKIDASDLDDLRDDAQNKQLDRRHAKILQPFDNWIVEHRKQPHMVLLAQVSPDHINWEARFPDASVAAINSPEQLAPRELPKSVKRITVCINVHNHPKLAQSWVELQRFAGIEVDLLNIDNIARDIPKPTDAQVAKAHDTLRQAKVHTRH